jgi:ABC-2 type transport system permease protein
MTIALLVRGETRKITTTKLPWVFLAVLVVIAGLNAGIVAFGTEANGTKAFVATGVDQQSLMAFAFNAMMGTSLFGAIAVAREYGHDTVVPMFLTSPNRTRAVLAQLSAIVLAGAALALIGQALIIGAVAQLLVSATLAGAAGAVLGAGLAAVIRNVGGAVTAAFMVLFLIPPLVAQLVSGAGSWIPTTLLGVIAGVGSDVSLWAALIVIAAWALIPAAAGLVTVRRRDVV